MAFHDVRLPDNVERGAKGGPTFNTLITTTETGFEVPTSRWSVPRQSWDIGYGLENTEDPASAVAAVRDFFYARQGRFHSFRFKDWSDYKVTTQASATGTGGPLSFQLTKKYVSGAYTYDRKIFTPIVASLALGVSSGPALSFSCSATGLVNIAFVGVGITVFTTFEFDNKVRFADDHLDLSMELYNVGEIPSIPIIEVR